MKKSRQLWELFITFFKIGLFTFGGGYAMISVIERETVEKKKWVTSEDILNMIVIAESTPGVIAVNSATFIGYKVAGVLGGIIATLGVTMPSFIIISILSLFIAKVKDNAYISAAFRGIRCAVSVLILNAVFKLAKPMKKTAVTVCVAAVAFLLSVFLEINAIYLILVGGLAGIIVYAIRYKGLKEVPENPSSEIDAKELEKEQIEIIESNDNNAEKEEKK